MLSPKNISPLRCEMRIRLDIIVQYANIIQKIRQTTWSILVISIPLRIRTKNGKAYWDTTFVSISRFVDSWICSSVFWTRSLWRLVVDKFCARRRVSYVLEWNVSWFISHFIQENQYDNIKLYSWMSHERKWYSILMIFFIFRDTITSSSCPNAHLIIKWFATVDIFNFGSWISYRNLFQNWSY